MPASGTLWGTDTEDTGEEGGTGKGDPSVNREKQRRSCYYQKIFKTEELTKSNVAERSGKIKMKKKQQ